jgi:hypothetical protein
MRRAPRFFPYQLEQKEIERIKKRPERGRTTHRLAIKDHTPIEHPEFMLNCFELQLFFHGCLKKLIAKYLETILLLCYYFI